MVGIAICGGIIRGAEGGVAIDCGGIDCDAMGGIAICCGGIG